MCPTYSSRFINPLLTCVYSRSCTEISPHERKYTLTCKIKFFTRQDGVAPTEVFTLDWFTGNFHEIADLNQNKIVHNRRRTWMADATQHPRDRPGALRQKSSFLSPSRLAGVRPLVLLKRSQRRRM
jgi:hypothetical protein